MSIPVWYERYLLQTLTYWTPTAHDGWGTQTWTYATLSGRWEDRAERFATPLGEEAISNAKVYLNSEVTTAGWLYPGESTASDPKNVSGAYPIRRAERVPTLRSGEYIYKAYL